MKPHPRIRKTIKWGGAVVTVLLVVVWIGSGWVSLAWFDLETRGFWIAYGVVHATIDGPRPKDVLLSTSDGPPPGWAVSRNRFSMMWQFNHSSFIYRHRVEVPLWAPAAFFAAATGIVWTLDARARRRAVLNLCPKCGYDRTGLASKDAKCPECGIGGVPA